MKAIHKFLAHPMINGNQSLAARLIGKTQQNVWQWAKSSKDETDLPVGLIRVAAKAIGESPLYLIPD